MSQTQAQYPSASSDDDRLGFGLKVSVALHLALAILILVKSLVFPGDPEPYVPTLRVDIVGLPDVLKKDLSQLARLPPPTSSAEPEAVKPVKMPEPVKMPKAAAPEEEQAAPDEMVLKPKAKDKTKDKGRDDEKARKDRMKSALARIKSLSKIAALEESDKPAEARPTALIKGNQVSKGSSLSGEARENARSAYYDQLRDRFQENWALPVWLERQKFSAQAQVWIDSRGRLLRYVITRGSGNAQFDEQVKRTIQQSQPFPLPPSEIQSVVSGNGISVGFPL